MTRELTGPVADLVALWRQDADQADFIAQAVLSLLQKDEPRPRLNRREQIIVDVLRQFAGKTLSLQFLGDSIEAKTGQFCDAHTIRVHMVGIRKKDPESKACIRTVHSYGYEWVEKTA